MAEPHDNRGADQVPDHLVQERGVEQRAGRACLSVVADLTFADGVRIVELEAPWQRGRHAVQFLVKPVAQSSDGLRYHQRRRDAIGQQGERITPVAAPQERGQGPHPDAAEDGHAAFPHLEDVDEVAGWREVDVGRRDAVVQTGPDQAAGHCDQRGVQHLVEGAPVLLPSDGEDPHGEDDSRQDADRIHVDRHRSDGELGEPR